MGWGYECNHFHNFECDLKKECTGSCSISYGSKLYENHCKSNYAIDPDDSSKGYKMCPYFKKIYGCHIVTAVCETLKAPKYIRISERFKEKLIESGKCREQLAIYNSIGPVIAKRIRGNEKICRILLERTIKPVCKLIETGKNDEALKQFTDMVTQFVEPEYRTNQENCKPNGVFTELMQYDPITIRDCEQSATTRLLGYRIDVMKKPPRLLKTL